MHQLFYFKVTLLGIIYVTELSSLYIYIYIQAICYIYQDMSVRIDFTEGYSFMGWGHGKDNHGP